MFIILLVLLPGYIGVPPIEIDPLSEIAFMEQLVDEIELMEEISEDPVIVEEPESSHGSHWLALADCESGEWDRHGNPIEGSRRWDYGAPGAFSRPNYPFHGGLNFHPDTWRWVAGDLGLLERYPYAYLADKHTQIEVGIETQRRQGWEAWPVCSRKVGLR